MNPIPTIVVKGADRLFDDLIDRLYEAGVTGCRIHLSIQPAGLDKPLGSPNIWQIATTLPERDELVRGLTEQVKHLSDLLAAAKVDAAR